MRLFVQSDGGGDLDHLQERDRAFLHAGAARTRRCQQRQSLGRRALHGGGDAFGGRDAGAVAARYPLDRFGGSAPLAYSAAVTDAAFACVDARLVDDLAPHAPVYAYEFDDPRAPAPEPFYTLPFPVGASHSLELRYLFDVGGARPFTPAQQVLSDQMLDYWSAFVRDGEPAVDGLPEWPRASDGRRLVLRPEAIGVADDFARVHQCDFWAGLRR